MLDLALVRRAGGLDALAAQLPAGAYETGAQRAAGATAVDAHRETGDASRITAVGAWIEVARRPPAATGADHAELALAGRASPRRSPARSSR